MPPPPPPHPEHANMRTQAPLPNPAQRLPPPSPTPGHHCQPALLLVLPNLLQHKVCQRALPVVCRVGSHERSQRRLVLGVDLDLFIKVVRRGAAICATQARAQGVRHSAAAPHAASSARARCLHALAPAPRHAPEKPSSSLSLAAMAALAAAASMPRLLPSAVASAHWVGGGTCLPPARAHARPPRACRARPPTVPKPAHPPTHPPTPLSPAGASSASSSSCCRRASCSTRALSLPGNSCSPCCSSSSASCSSRSSSPPLSSPPSALCRLSLWEWCLVCVGAQAAKAGDQARTYALHAPHPPTQGHAAPPPHAGRGVHPASPARHSSRGPRFAPPATACAARAPAPAASCPWRLPGCAGGAAGGRGSGLAPAAGAVRRAAAAGGALDPCWLGREGA